MKISWTKGLSEQKAKDIKQKFKESSLLRRRLKAMLADIIKDKRKSQVSLKNYNNPNWPYLQADHAGYERAIRDVMEIIQD